MSPIQTITDTTDTVLTADTELYDLDTMHSTSSNTSRITITTAGKYRFGASLYWNENNSTGRRIQRFLVNGSTQYRSLAADADPWMSTFGSRTLDLVATDYVEVQVHQTAGANRTVILGEFFATHVAR